MRHSPLTPPSLDELKNQLRDLRASVELLKTQHRCVMKPKGTDEGLGRNRAADLLVFAAFQAGSQAVVQRAG